MEWRQLQLPSLLGCCSSWRACSWGQGTAGQVWQLFLDEHSWQTEAHLKGWQMAALEDGRFIIAVLLHKVETGALTTWSVPLSRDSFVRASPFESLWLFPAPISLRGFGSSPFLGGLPSSRFPCVTTARGGCGPSKWRRSSSGNPHLLLYFGNFFCYFFDQLFHGMEVVFGQRGCLATRWRN